MSRKTKTSKDRERFILSKVRNKETYGKVDERKERKNCRSLYLQSRKRHGVHDVKVHKRKKTSKPIEDNKTEGYITKKKDKRKT